MVIRLSETLAYIHKHGLLHNDIKSDNIVLYFDEKQLKPVLIDFGKACAMEDGKHYKLSDEEKKKYREKHTQIAPEIVDGTAPQSTASDIYSLGRVVCHIGMYGKWLDITKLGSTCAEPNMAKRCSLTFLIGQCHLLL